MSKEYRPDFAIKTNPKYLKEVIKGNKTFTIRKNDKPYKVGAIVRKFGWEKDFGMTQDKSEDFKITYMLTHEDFPEGIKKGYCVCSIKPLDEINKDQQIEQLKAENERLKRELRKSDNKNKDNDIKLKSRQQYITKLEQQLAEKDAEIELDNKAIVELNNKLKEKNTKIEHLKDAAHASCLQMEKYQQEKWNLENKLKINTHQVCEKIRERYDLSSQPTEFGLANMVSLENLSQFLDQLENNAEGEK